MYIFRGYNNMRSTDLPFWSNSYINGDNRNEYLNRFYNTKTTPTRRSSIITTTPHNHQYNNRLNRYSQSDDVLTSRGVVTHPFWGRNYSVWDSYHGDERWHASGMANGGANILANGGARVVNGDLNNMVNGGDRIFNGDHNNMVSGVDRMVNGDNSNVVNGGGQMVNGGLNNMVNGGGRMVNGHNMINGGGNRSNGTAATGLQNDVAGLFTGSATRLHNGGTTNEFYNGIAGGSNNSTSNGLYNSGAGSHNGAAVGLYTGDGAIGLYRTGYGIERRRLEKREYRYGGRRRERPHERDLPYWLGIRPNHPPDSRSAVNGVSTSRAKAVPDEVPLRRNVLTVTNVDLHIPTNTKEHRTNCYECTEIETDRRLVVRRGDVFVMTLTFQRPWSSRHDDLFFRFTVGKNPSVHTGSLVTFQLTETNSDLYRVHGHWGARIHSQRGSSLSMYVYIAPDAIVGEWECVVTTSLTGTGETFTYEGVGDIYVLFNPWRKVDQVYYSENPKDLDEYVLNEYGCVFAGESDHISQTPWFYGQFQDGILDICMTILRMAFEMEVTPEMGDAVSVTRKLSRIINNSSRDPGVLTGNWSGNYSEGTPPHAWKGSVQILKQYARTQLAVKYAQCWVFSHVLTTVCRALGIPCRSLTNFESAHDTDKTVTIDSYRDENGEDLPEYKADSIWNFHCWNDVWINRPDLDNVANSRNDEGGYSGWHAIDATPQERSNGRFQCGPCPHKAIKHGELSIGFDTNFIFGEVNGEVCVWMIPYDPLRDLELISRDPSAVGKKISTKLPDGQPATRYSSRSMPNGSRMDITGLYKFPEGSSEERAAVRRAVGKELGVKLFGKPGGISLEILKPKNTTLGSDFAFVVVASNQDHHDHRHITVTMAVFPIDYKGVRLGRESIAEIRGKQFELPPGASKYFELPVKDHAYLAQCDKSMAMMLTASARIEGEDKPVSEKAKMVLSSPELEIRILNSEARIFREQPFTVRIIVKNPCSKALTGCRFQLTGTIHPLPSQGLVERDGAHHGKIRDVQPNQETHFDIQMKAQKTPLANNHRELDIALISNQLPDMTGSLNIYLA